MGAVPLSESRIVDRLISLVPRAFKLNIYHQDRKEANDKIPWKIPAALKLVRELHATLCRGELLSCTAGGEYHVEYSFDQLRNGVRAHRLTLHQKCNLENKPCEDEGKFIEFFTDLDQSLRLDIGIRMGVTNFQNPPVLNMIIDEREVRHRFVINDAPQRDKVPSN